MRSKSQGISQIVAFRDEYYFLSNFYASPIIYEGLLYPTVEHAFQAAKSHDENFRYKLAYRTETPNLAKRHGREVKLRKDWGKVRVEIMTLLVKKKFRIPTLRKALLATGDATLVEGNTWGDDFWGVCKGKGLNKLGLILMAERERIRKLK